MRPSFRSLGLFAAAAFASLTAASAARADFVFSHTRTTIDVGGTAYDRVTFYARNDGLGYTAGGEKKLLGLELNVSSTGAMRFGTGHIADTFQPVAGAPSGGIYVESDLGLDIDLAAPQAALVAGSFAETKLIGEIFSPSMLAMMPSVPQVHSKNGFDPVAAYAATREFYSVAAALGLANAVPAGTGLGAAFASIVTTSGAAVTVSGQIGGDNAVAGPVNAVSDASSLAPAYPLAAATGEVYLPYSYTALAPEPATLAALLTLLPIARRRR